jgi:hypothetical protein
MTALAPWELAAIIASYRFVFNDEEGLHVAIATALDRLRIPYQREVSLSAHDRIDFMVGTTGVEVKVAGSRAEILRQLHRYAGFSGIAALILATTRARHLDLPASLQEKPIFVASLLEGAF